MNVERKYCVLAKEKGNNFKTKLPREAGLARMVNLPRILTWNVFLREGRELGTYMIIVNKKGAGEREMDKAWASGYKVTYDRYGMRKKGGWVFT